jgi:hypothetical protein
MSELTIWNWDRKQRTMLRYIKAGDIFCFQYNERTYCFGRIITRLKIGTPSEIFDYVSSTPVISKDTIINSKRMFHPVNLDVYTLFDRKLMGEWRIIGKDDNYTPVNVEDVFFTFGIAPCKRIDVFGNETIITKNESDSIQDFGFLNDFHIKELVKHKINKEYTDPFQFRIEKTNINIMDKIKPFILVVSAHSSSLLLNVGQYKNHIFSELNNSEFCGNGYDWTSLAEFFISERLPHLNSSIRFDSETDMFCARSDNAKSIKEFAVAFHEMCENDELMKALLTCVILDNAQKSQK